MLRYVGAYLIAAGSTSNVCASTTYQANNVVEQWRTVFISATIVSIGVVGGVVGSLAFRHQDAPNYRPGLYTGFMAATLTIVSMTTISVYMFVKNKQQAKGKIVIEGVLGFRYTL